MKNEVNVDISIRKKLFEDRWWLQVVWFRILSGSGFRYQWRINFRVLL
jgi:hypothetical protein